MGMYSVGMGWDEDELCGIGGDGTNLCGNE